MLDAAGAVGVDPVCRLSALDWAGLAAAFDESPAIVVVFLGPEHVLAYQNRQSERLLGARRIGDTAAAAFPEYPEWRNRLSQVYTSGEPARLDHGPVSVAVRGQRQVVLLDAVHVPLRDGDEVVGVLCQSVDVTARHARAQQPRRAAALSRAAAELSRSLDLDRVTATVTRLAAEVFDGWCLLDLWQADGTLRRVGGTHHDPGKQPLLQQMFDMPRISGRLRGDVESVAARVARTGEAIVGEFDPVALLDVASSTAHARILAELRPGPYLMVPVQVGARRLGALIVLRTAGGAPFLPAERVVAEQFAERAAIALAHAADYDEQRQAALTLQRSLLPSAIPAVPGAELAVRYRAGDAGTEVGGDWYDAFPLPGGSLGVAVGDVEGHDLGAAAVMGQVRSVVHAYARGGNPPSLVAERANAFLAELASDRLVTLTYLQVHPAEGLVVWVRAGHMPAVLVPARGVPQVLRGRGGLPLGVDPEAQWSEETVHLPAGALLAVFTDGLVEGPGMGFDEGVDGLIEVLAAGVDDDLETVADNVLARLPGDRRHVDDIALVLLRLTAVTDADRRSVVRRLPAVASSTPIARRFVTDLLPQWGLDDDATETAALLVSELMANASRHSDGAVELRMRLTDGRLRGGVFDESHRLPALREVDPEDTAGRGLQLVDLLAERWGVDTEDRGKCVWFELVVPYPEPAASRAPATAT